MYRISIKKGCNIMVTKRELCKRILADEMRKLYNTMPSPIEMDTFNYYHMHHYFKGIRNQSTNDIVTDIPKDILEFMNEASFLVEHPAIAIAMDYLGLLNPKNKYHLDEGYNIMTLIDDDGKPQKLGFKELIELFPEEVEEEE